MSVEVLEYATALIGLPIAILRLQWAEKGVETTSA